MDILQITLSVMGIAAYLATATFACYAFGRLKRQETDLDILKMVTTKTLALVTGEHLRSSFEALNDMKDALQGLIDDERFEEAEDLKETIDKMERMAFKELERFKKNFGEDCVDIKMTNVRRD